MTNFDCMISEPKPTLVDFYAQWCGPCKMQSPIIDKIGEKMGNQINIIKIDVDHDKELASIYQISAIPTLIIFKNGKLLWRASGLKSATEIESILREIL